ncbi:MAG: TonB-dependent receptor [Bacteroidales bacterium]
MKKYALILLVLFPISQVFGQTEEDEDTTRADLEVQEEVEIFTISESELSSGEQSQDIAGLLHSSDDIFVQRAAYIFSQARFDIRGYDNRYLDVTINNMVMNNMENGPAYWSNWGGLNDAVRNKTITIGLEANDYGFGNVAGLTNITMRASKDRKQTRLTYSLANKSYTNRAMFIHSTGMMDNGWAFTLSGSKRWANEGYVEGSFYDAYAYLLSVERKLNDKHSIGLIGFGAPSRRGKNGVGTQEVYDLAGSNFYNPYWGYQEGEKRNSRISNYHKPKVLINHYWDIDEKQKLTSGINYTFGRGGSTRLNWYDAADPRPDYYKKLPSYWEDDPDMYQHYNQLWQSGNSDVTQLNWESFYQANAKNLYTVNNAEGTVGNDVTGMRSKYIIEEGRTDIKQYGANSTYKNRMNEYTTFTGALNFRFYKGHHFQTVVDLLGGDYWLDIDQFAERDFADPSMADNDLDNPNHIAKEGDIIGYDYVANINSHDAFLQLEFEFPQMNRVDYYVSGKLSYTEFWRTGNRRNGKFPTESLGDAPKNEFIDYGFKTGLTHKITGRHFIMFNAGYMTNAPYFRDAYISPRTRDHTVDDLESEKILSGDLSYVWTAPSVDLRMTGFFTSFRDGLWNRSFYHDELNSFVNYVMTDLDKLHYGTELGLDVNITPTWSVNAAGSWGQYIYTSRPSVTIAQDNDSEIIADDRTVYIENYHLGNMPEVVGSFGIKYDSPNYWFAGANINYFDRIFLDFSPDRRTAEAMDNFVEDDPQWDEMLDQQMLDANYTVNFFGGKSFKFGDYYAGFTLSVNNVLNTTDFIIGGFEQYRYDIANIDKFPPKYFYMYGRTYFLNVYFSF